MAQAYALPIDVSERWGIRRYGFHGISCRPLVHRVAELGMRPSQRLLICHLGSGASVTAVFDSRSQDTSMGLTPLEGLAMSTRSGDLDRGLYSVPTSAPGLDVDALEDLLERKSGLSGLSGGTGDYATLEAAAQKGDMRAARAIEIFAYRVRKYLGAYLAVLGGVDTIVLTVRSGENSASARAAIIGPLASLRVGTSTLRRTRPAQASDASSRPGERPEIWVIPTRETLEIARELKVLVEEAGHGEQTRGGGLA